MTSSVIDLLIANIAYVSLRLFVTGNIVLAFRHIYRYWMNEKTSWYLAVASMAQISFWCDYFIFGTI